MKTSPYWQGHPDAPNPVFHVAQRTAKPMSLIHKHGCFKHLLNGVMSVMPVPTWAGGCFHGTGL